MLVRHAPLALLQSQQRLVHQLIVWGSVNRTLSPPCCLGWINFSGQFGVGWWYYLRGAAFTLFVEHLPNNVSQIMLVLEAVALCVDAWLATPDWRAACVRYLSSVWRRSNSTRYNTPGDIGL